MTSAALGVSTFPVAVTNISQHGFWLLLEEQELFPPFANFPWFRARKVTALIGAGSTAVVAAGVPFLQNLIAHDPSVVFLHAAYLTLVALGMYLGAILGAAMPRPLLPGVTRAQ